MALLPSGYSASFSPSTSLSTTVAAQSAGSAGAKYAAGKPGSAIWTPGGGCIEARAIEAGSAVSNHPDERICHKIQGITIPIGPSFVSVQALAEYVNMEFSCNGTAGTVSTNLQLQVALG